MTENQLSNNVVYLTGEVKSEPRFSHKVFGEGFYECAIAVKRLSEQVDIIPITVSDRLVELSELREGNKVSIYGQFRSYNKISDGRSKLLLTVFVRELLADEPDRNPNQIEITGYVCKEPVFRTTPFKREICDILIAVNRAYNKSDYIPCITWGRNAHFASGLSVGDKIMLSGRIQSREYQKILDNGEIETRTAYEISVNRISLFEGDDEVFEEE